MKKDWTYKKLGEVASFSRGLTYSKHDEAESSENVVLRSNNIDLSSGKLDLTELKFLKKDYIIPEDKRLKRGSIFICMSNGSKAHLGKVAYIDKDYGYAYGGFMGQITPNEELNGRYLHYALSSPEYKQYIKSLSEGANINNLKYKDLELFEIPLPPLSEQSRIVSRLDAAFGEIEGLKAKAEAQLREARTLFQAALTQEMKPKQGWEEKAIGEIFKTYAGGTPSKTDKSYYEDGNIPWIRSGEVCRKYITECEMFITEKGMKHSSAKYYPVDTVLVAMYGATAAQVGILKFEATSNQAVCGILPHKDYVPEFVYYWFTNIQKELEGQAQGNAQPNISQEKIKRVLIPTIPLSVQQSIVSRLDALSEKVRELEETQKKVIAESDALKQALLREVFE